MNAILLAGGRSMRMGGLDKALLPFRSSTFLGYKLVILRPRFEKILVVVSEPGQYERFGDAGTRIVTDESPGQGSLMGLWTGLKASESAYNFVTTVDSPFTRSELISLLFENSEDQDVCVPEWNGFLEPLCAVYARACIPHIGKVLDRKRIVSFYESVRVHILPERTVRAADPEGLSFININTPEEYLKWMQ
jgi:molybdopterin-guanine dinucleotide biosynthesis protein A